MIKRVAIVAGLLIFSFAIYFTLISLKSETPLTDVPEKQWPVQVQSIHPETITPTYQVYGEIIAARRTQLRSQVNGAITALNPMFNPGSYVTKDTVLVEIDSFDYLNQLNERQADVREARAKLTELTVNAAGEENLLPQDKELVSLAQREVNRQKKLLKSSAGRRKTYDDALSTLTERRQKVLSREQTLSRLSAQKTQAQAALERAQARAAIAERDFENTKITAPYDGFLHQTQAALGQPVSNADLLGELISLHHLEVALHVNEAQFNQLTGDHTYIGQKLQIRWGGHNSPQTAVATLLRSSGEIDPQSSGRTLFARLEGLTPETSLRPGLFVSATITGPTYKNVIALPQTALFDGNKVFEVVDNRLKPHQVNPLLVLNDQILLPNMLPKGSQIVTTRFPELGEGMKVEVKP